jgi:hypothetical protein
MQNLKLKLLLLYMTGPDRPVSDSEIDEHMNERDGRTRSDEQGDYIERKKK